MKIFATSDIHGNKTIMDKLFLMDGDVDLILICGDIGGKGLRFKTLQHFVEYQKQDIAYFYATLEKLTTPVKFILGNDDWFETTSKFHLAKEETITGVKLIPFEYVSITPFNTNREVNENKLSYELGKLAVDANSIIVAHTPPLWAGDTVTRGGGVGSKVVREWIHVAKPKIWFNGHIHEDNSVSKIGETLVFNCACNFPDNMLKGWIVDTETLDFERVNI